MKVGVTAIVFESQYFFIELLGGVVTDNTGDIQVFGARVLIAKLQQFAKSRVSIASLTSPVKVVKKNLKRLKFSCGR
jgi:hypothetical protein